MAIDRTQIAQFKLQDGTEVLFEVPKPPSGNGFNEIAISDFGENIIEVAAGVKGSFESSVDKLLPVAQTVLDKLKAGLTTPADEVSVKLGANLTASGGIVFAKLGGGVSIEVTMTWKEES